jgi:polyribonucleotide nucleotidyltransferase
MFKNSPLKLETVFNNQKLTLETGLLALQATANIIATIGETTVMANVVVGKPSDTDYFPLQVIYEEKMYASGKIRGSRFEKREGKPSDQAVLTGRMIDRSLRSLFDADFRNSVQVIITVLSVDEINPPDTLGVIAGSVALAMATPDFEGPVSSVRIGLISDHQTKLINPTYQEMATSMLDLIVSGDGTNIMMVEAGANIIDEDMMGECLEVASEQLKVLTAFQNDFVTQAKSQGLAKQIALKSQKVDSKYYEYWANFTHLIENIMYSPLGKEDKNKHLMDFEKHHKHAMSLATAYKLHLNSEKRQELENFDPSLTQTILNLVESDIDIYTAEADLFKAFHSTIKKVVQNNILHHDRRVDGRKLDETRSISCQVDVLPRVHGSSLFNRGETQVMNILTLGTLRDVQTLDGMEEFEEASKRYIHHYNFPAYSVGETGRYGSAGRREIGHGALAERALLPVLPTQDEFPYTMRLVSECLGSNGSTSMASTCGSTLSLMAGGVPIKDMVGGVAMGLVLEKIENNFGDLSGIELETERLLLKPLSMDYVDDIFEHKNQNVSQWTGSDATDNKQDIVNFVTATETKIKSGNSIVFCVIDKESGEFYGMCGCNNFASSNPYLGIWLKEDIHSKGIGFESTIAVINWVKSNVKYEYLEYKIIDGNEKSEKLALKLGFNLCQDNIKIERNFGAEIVFGKEYRLQGNFTPKFKVLTDIQGLEDHHGDMDFKVTGTTTGITAIQLDNKVAGLTVEILKQALHRAKVGRVHIIDVMKTCISEPKPDLSQYAPIVLKVNVPLDKIGDVIGTGGKIIRAMEEKFGCDVDLENETGTTCIYGKNIESVTACKNYILALIKTYSVGDIVSVKVTKILAFGAVAQIDGTTKEGMIHISKLANYRVEKVEDIVNIGDTKPVKIYEIKDNGNIGLTLLV